MILWQRFAHWRTVASDARFELSVLQDHLGSARYVSQIWAERAKSQPQRRVTRHWPWPAFQSGMADVRRVTGARAVVEVLRKHA